MPNIAVKLAESLKSWGVDMAYGKPIVADGMTIIPVAYVAYGFGGGGADESAGGGGGGGTTIPLGVYRIADGTVRFIPNLVVLIAASGPLVIAVGMGLSRILRALR